MTEQQKAAMRLSLEALEAMNPYPASKEDQRASAITALRAALDEPEPEPVACSKTFSCRCPKHYSPEPEPVAWMAEEWQQRIKQMLAEAISYKEAYFRLVKMIAKSKAMEPGCPVFLATSPARKPLTDEEIRDLWSWSMTAEAERTATTLQHVFARAIERAHGITGGQQ